VHIGDAAIVQLKQCIVGSARVCKGRELYAVQWMTGCEFKLDFADECVGLSRNKLAPGF
jgi:hypothetical protein